MCYDIKTLTQRGVKYALRHAKTKEETELLEAEYEELLKFTPPQFHSSGFSHPLLPVIRNDSPSHVSLLQWGLIPAWCKDDKSALLLSNQTLNARSETVFEKPSYRQAIRKRRCLVMADGFYEHYHQDKKSYPFYFSLRNEEPMTLAGIYEHWQSPQSGIVRETLSILTVPANELMLHIHNKPGEEGPRMPLIIPAGRENEWLEDIKADEDLARLKGLMKPFNGYLNTYPVAALRGKNRVINPEDSSKQYEYPELQFLMAEVNSILQKAI